MDEFLAKLKKISDELLVGNIRILAKVDEHIDEVEKIMFQGCTLTDKELVDGFSEEEMLVFTSDEENKKYCSCMQPAHDWSGEPMVACDFCLKWYHCNCVGLTMDKGKRETNWRCDF